MKRSHSKAHDLKGTRIPQQAADAPPSGWAEDEHEIARTSGISLLLVAGHQPPALDIANNNSICEALQASPEHVKLCDPFCGSAYDRATAAGAITHYRCHAGLHCFAMPIDIDERKLAVIGGRAFIRGSDYRETMERFHSGDLQGLASDNVFRNVIFADEADLDHAALRITRVVGKFTSAESGKRPAPIEPANVTDTPNEAARAARTLESELPRPQDNEARVLADAIRRFAEQIDASDPAQTYESIVTQSADLVSAERSSLLLFDESENCLTMTAARGIPVAVSAVAPITVGEGIVGTVLRENRPLVATVDEMGRSSPPERRYKTKSFISYPIAIGKRRLGVLNLADKIGGGLYDIHDLSIIDLVAPQIALAMERAEWQRRANQFQLMSITDPLTGLHNRRYLEARLAEELSRSKRYNYPLSFMMIDIDDFKLYNDTNGHQAGDRALEIVAQCLHAALRKVDVASRYGGEEFSILLPQTSLEEAGVIADRIRRKIMTTSFPHGASQPLGMVTASIGLSSFSPSLNSAEAIVRAADRALYHAKRHGKNRAYAYQGIQGTGPSAMTGPSPQ
ncbi:MAG TPA: diguanylate cyclase [Pyrinomonadaceae bacterium]|jgi:diguanylate cyclase (GGDEF)-like protein|nr:diguanylate cyclase [Pyrinomonadaceae bacterium]